MRGEQVDEGRAVRDAEAAVGQPQAVQREFAAEGREQFGVGERLEVELAAGQHGGASSSEATRAFEGEVGAQLGEQSVAGRWGRRGRHDRRIGAAPRAAAMIHCRPMATDAAAIEVAMIVPRTEAEGPGLRYAVWVQGCPLRCVGCCNPEMLAFKPADRRDPEALVAEAVAAGVEGVSLLGGEPFAQAGGLARLAEGARAQGLSVMVFSGYTLAELRAQGPAAARLLAATDLLVDGRYDATRRTTTRRYIGSDNQVLHFLTPRYSPEDPRLHAANTLELRLRGGEITLNGWPVLGPRTRVV